ncbi:MAG: multidrug efflux RND transporter permease subunit [Planctomycetes bacterium]|nr:multidrug efflux RND transporter permease subunit [Planctomycetota bacterium]
MKLSHFFIDRPIFATVLSLVAILIGGVAYFSLPVAQYPEVVPPTVEVSASYPGASPQVIADTVAAPLEQAINGVDGMLYMTSSSTADGRLALTVTFELGTDVDEAQVLVQNRVASAEPRLPELVRRAGVTTLKNSPDIMLVAHLVSPDGRYDQLFMGNYAYLRMRDELARIDGVGDVRIFGADEYGMRVWLDPQKLRALDMTVGDVLSALREQNVQVAAGVIGQEPLPSAGALQLTVQARGRLTTAEEFGDIVVKRGDGAGLVRLREVARVELGAQSYAMESRLDGEKAVAVVLFQRPGSNALETEVAIQDSLRRLSADFPDGMEYRVVYNPTVFVEQSIESVVHTLLEAVFLVVLVVLLFLQNWRASIIPLAAIPVSLVGTFAVMAAIGFSLNNLTLFGLVLAIGIVVDDAIVVVENVERHLAAGLSPRDATRKAMDEVSGALVAMALVLVAVFVPTAFLSGIAGQFYRQFAVTIATATVISAVVSLTLSPAMAAVQLRAADAPPDRFQRAWDFLFGWFFRLFDRAFEWSAGRYARVVRRTVRLGLLLGILYVGLMGLTGYGLSKVPRGFIPAQDQGYLILAVQLPDGASMARTREVVTQVSKLARGVDGVAHSVEFVGFSGATRATAPNVAAIFLPLEPFEVRGPAGRSADVISNDVRAALAPVVEGLAIVIPPPPVRGIGTGGGFKLMLEDKVGGSSAALQDVAFQLVGGAMQEPGIVQPYTFYRGRVPQLFADVDRARAKQLDVPLSDVFEALQTSLGSTYVNDFNRFGRTYRVIAQADAQFRDEEADLRALSTRNRAGEIVPLGSLVKTQRITGPDRVVRHNLTPAAEVGGSTAPGWSTGQSIDTMERLAAALPPGYDFEWVDLAYQEKSAGDTAMLVFGLAVVFVFLLLAAQYESWSLPLAIVLIVPMCLLGAAGGLLLRGMDNNVLTQIGFVVLIGLAAKNAILIVEFAHQLERAGRDRFEAAVEASRLRLRPILMTAFSFILGVVPLVFATGPGAEMRQSIGTAVFAGMIGVTAFGLVFTPLFYVLVRGAADALGRRLRPKTAEGAALPEVG